MKTIYQSILFFLSILPLVTIAQQRWDIYFGYPDRTDLAFDLFETYDGGYFMSNAFRSSDYNLKGWLIKTDINGEILWEKTIITDLYGVGPLCSDQNDNGEIVVSGFSNTNSAFLMKLNNCGEKLWCNLINLDVYDLGQDFSDITFLENGNILALFWGQSSDPTVDRIFLYCFDSEGNLLWKKPYASYQEHTGIMDPSPFSFTKIDDFYIISGYGWFQNAPDNYALRLMFIKIDSLFNEEWLLPFGISDSIYGAANSSIQNLNGTISGVGLMYPKDEFSNPIIANFNSEGSEINYYQIPNSSFSEEISGSGIKKLIIENDSTYYTRSSFKYTISTITSANFIIDTIGNVLEYKVIQPDAISNIYSSIKTKKSKYLNSVQQAVSQNNTDILLYKLNPDLTQADFDTTTYVYDSLCDHPIVSDTIYLDDCGIITDLRDIPSPTEYYSYISSIPVHIFPNPATSGITFEFENTEYHKDIVLRCYDINGHMVFEEALPNGQTQINTTVSNWPGGMYVATAGSRNGGTGKEKFVVRK